MFNVGMLHPYLQEFIWFISVNLHSSVATACCSKRGCRLGWHIFRGTKPMFYDMSQEFWTRSHPTNMIQLGDLVLGCEMSSCPVGTPSCKSKPPATSGSSPQGRNKEAREQSWDEKHVMSLFCTMITLPTLYMPSLTLLTLFWAFCLQPFWSLFPGPSHSASCSHQSGLPRY